MGRPKGSKNKIERVKPPAICINCGPVDPYKFRYKLQLCAKCDNKRWWNSHKDKCLASESRTKTRKEWGENNKELLRQRDKARHALNKVRDAARRKEQRIDRSIRCNQRYRDDIQYRLSVILRKRIWHALKGNQKTGSAIDDLGCSIAKLKIRLQLNFHRHPADGHYMTWDNQGKNGWHIDHIIPLDSFDLSDPEQFKKACHYTNLQPLWAKDNLIKGAKI